MVRALLLATALLVSISIPSSCPASRSLRVGIAPAAYAQYVSDIEDRVDRQRAAKVSRRVYRTVREITRVYRVSVRKWFQWSKRALFFSGIAVLVTLLDLRLIRAWRSDGLIALRTYVPVMIYSFGYLLLSRKANSRDKMLLALAIAYGVVPNDLLRDRAVLPGYLDDFVLIALATRRFVARCPEEIIEKAAHKAVNWRARSHAIQRQRQKRSSATGGT